MADVKISALPLASTPLAGTEVLPIVQSATTDQVSVANLTAGRAVSAASLTLTTTPLAVGSGGTGTSTAFTAGSVIFADASGVYSQNNNELFWSSANSRLGVGTPTPAFKLEISSGYNNGMHLKDTTGTVYGGYFVEATTMALVTRSNHGLRFGTNDTTRMYLDNIGNVGIGTGSPGQKLNVAASSDTMVARIWGASYGLTFNSDASTGFRIEATDPTGFGSYQPLITNGSIQILKTGATERARIDSSGNLLVGTTTNGSSSKLLVVGSNFSFGTTNSAIEFQFTGDGTNGYVDARLTGGGLIFRTNGSTESMRIDSSGNLLVGTTSQLYSGKQSISFSSNTGRGLTIYDTAIQNNATFIAFLSATSTAIGSITANGTTAVLYNTTSDVSLKENITPANSSLASILAFPVDQFDWKSDGSHTDYGCVAQKAINYAPEMVTQGDIWAVDYGRITPRLIKAFQELAAKVQALEAKVA